MRKGVLIQDWEDGGMKRGDIVEITSPPSQDVWDEFMGSPIYRANSNTGYNRLPQHFVKIIKEKNKNENTNCRF